MFNKKILFLNLLLSIAGICASDVSKSKRGKAPEVSVEDQIRQQLMRVTSRNPKYQEALTTAKTLAVVEKSRNPDASPFVRYVACIPIQHKSMWEKVARAQEMMKSGQ
ncbi:MAG: hypothetical protein WD055_01210 [Candidatus Dependentiae bacterium]